MTALNELVPDANIQDTNSSLTSQDGIQSNEHNVSAIFIGLCISMFGFVGNLFNIIIYWRLGLKDSMSVALFALSITDCLATFLRVTINLCFFIDILYPNNPVDAWALGYFAFGWTLNVVYMCSCWITAFISIERCFCVVSPFKVKKIFTRYRCVIAILTIYIIHIGFVLAIYIMHRMEWVKIPAEPNDGHNTKLSKRVFTVTFTKETARVELILDITVSLTISDLSFIIMIICTFWMIHALKVSSNVRSVSSSHTSETAIQKSKINLSTKERKLIKVVLALAITLTVCGLPRIVVIILYNAKQYMTTGQNINLGMIVWTVAYTFSIFGCSIPIFIYLLVNTNYRSKFYQIIGYQETKSCI